MIKQIVDYLYNRTLPSKKKKKTAYWYILLKLWILKPLSWVRTFRCKGVYTA